MKTKGSYHMGIKEIKIVYAYYDALFAENENDLQCLPYQFNVTVKELNMTASLKN